MGHATRSPRLLMVTARFPPYAGGIETHVREVAPRLLALGTEVAVLTTDPTGQLAEREMIDGVPVVRVRAYPRDRDYYFAPGIAEHIRSGAYDLVHLQGYHNLVAPLTMLAAHRARIPYVVSFHSGGHSAHLRRTIRGVQRLALRPGFRAARRLIAVSEFEQNLFARSLRMAPWRFELVRNGCRMPAPRTSPDLAVPLVVSVGRLERYKGHHRLISAWPKVLEQQPFARLRIVGEGPYEGELRRQIDALGLQTSVTIGSVPPGEPQLMADVLGAASLVALLSDYEAHPIAVVEALAVGRPVLVTDSSGLHELIVAGLARGVDRHATAGDIAAAVISQLNEPPAVHAASLPTWDDCARQLNELYRSVLA